jgi:hypothetical protein
MRLLFKLCQVMLSRGEVVLAMAGVAAAMTAAAIIPAASRPPSFRGKRMTSLFFALGGLGRNVPPGYPIADVGPHPNPAKAAGGKRLHKLDTDPEAMPVVVRTFAEFVAGSGIYAIAEGLTCDGIPSPSAHDPGRNSHRSGIRPALRCSANGA